MITKTEGGEATDGFMARGGPPSDLTKEEGNDFFTFLGKSQQKSKQWLSLHPATDVALNKIRSSLFA